MTRILATLLVLASLAAPRQAHAYAFSCRQAVALVQTGTDQNLYTVVGYAIGTVDFLAGLQCFVASSSCGCVSNLLANRPADYGEAFAEELIACVDRGEGGSPAFGPALRAARRFCGF